MAEKRQVFCTAKKGGGIHYCGGPVPKLALLVLSAALDLK